MIFYLLADELQKIVNSTADDYIFYSTEQNGDFGFQYMRNYSGLMAKPPKTGRNAGILKKSKQGYFDITVSHGTRYLSGVTHRMIFHDIMEHSSLDKCFDVWRGTDPRTIEGTNDEQEALVTLCLLMFEQEINWGTEDWQKNSNFAPYQRTPNRRRPRDMIMGFLRQAFDLGIDNIKYWMKIKPGTVTFNNPEGDNADYGSYPATHKRYFEELQQMDGTAALIVNDYRESFRKIANAAATNPRY